MRLKKQNKKIIGKIGFVYNSVLEKSKPGFFRAEGGHYVFIRNYNPVKETVDVYTFTSLEDRNRHFFIKHLYEVKLGHVYAIPRKDITLPRWSGISDTLIYGVPLKYVKNIGRYKMKRRHYFFRKYFKGK